MLYQLKQVSGNKILEANPDTATDGETLCLLMNNSEPHIPHLSNVKNNSTCSRGSWFVS